MQPGQGQQQPPQVSQVQRMLNRLSTRIAQQEAQIAALSIALEDAHQEIATLRSKIPAESEKKQEEVPDKQPA
jgi:uncharacterized coiled-coil protein SlyX